MTDAKTRVRAYQVKHHANAGKLAVFTDLLPHWQRGLVHMQWLQVEQLKSGSRLGLRDTKGLPDYLTQRQWKSIVNQVNAALLSWQELAVIEMRTEIRNADLTEAGLVTQYRINAARAWWSPNTQIRAGFVVTEADLALARRLITQVARTRLPFPDMSQTRTMLMDGPIAQLEDSRTGQFDWWLRVSGVDKGRPVRIPLTSSVYLEAAPGDLAAFAQVHVDDHGAVTIRLVKKSEMAAPRTEGATLALDWGLASLLTTSAGDRLGQRLYPWLRARDQELSDLQADLSRNGIRYRDSKRWVALTTRIRGYVTNDVGRILNKLAATQVRELVVEDLDLRGKGLSPALRRLVSRAGRGALKAKLERLTQDTGITVTKVNPAYTSQECCGCGYTAPTNRTTQSRFRCGFCAKTLNADVNAARVQARRRSSGREWQYTTRQQVLAHLDDHFHATWGTRFADVRQRQPRPLQSGYPGRIAA